MASKSTNSTIIVVAVVGIGGYAAYRYLRNKGGSAAAAAPSYPGVGSSGYGSDYYAPYDQQQPSLLNSLLQGLGALLGKKSATSPSASTGSSSSAGKPSAATLAGGGGVTPDIFNSIIEGFLPNGDFQGSEANAALGGDSLYGYTPDASVGEAGIGAIPYEDASGQLSLPGTFITSANDGSTDAYAYQDSVDAGPSGYADTSYSGEDVGFIPEISTDSGLGAGFDTGFNGDGGDSGDQSP